MTTHRTGPVQDQLPISDDDAPAAGHLPPGRELEELRAENARLRRLLEITEQESRAAREAQPELALHTGGPVTSRSPAETKVAFYRSLFGACTDIYALRWENARAGTSGWVPAVAGGWRKWMDRETADYLPLTPAAIEAHLRGSEHLGLYSLTGNDGCHFVASDFDGAAALLDALAYTKAARHFQVPAALEISQSGRGAHVWIFFTQEVPAADARALASALLAEAMDIRGSMSLRSYDRLFPSQDRHTGKAMGNLIAAPLNGKRRQHGATLFLDTSTLEPYADQWAYLSTLGRVTPAELGRLVRRLPAPVTGAKTRFRAPTATRIVPRTAALVHAEIGSRITVRSGDLGPAMVSALKHAASLPNPLFFEKQRQRRSTWDTPRFLTSYDETLEGDLVLPRGVRPLLEDLVHSAGSTLQLEDVRERGTAQEFAFTGELREGQRQAVDHALAHELSLIVAAPGSGKTVMALAVAATRNTSTLILVDRNALADQWRAQVLALLGVKAGQLGGGRTKLRGVVDVALLPTLARKKDVARLCTGYGQVIVDECHHVPAAAFTHVMNQIPAAYWLGLTATPYRRDGLEELIFHQLGTDSHEFAKSRPGQLPHAPGQAPAPALELRLHETAYDYAGDAVAGDPGGLHEIYRDLMADPGRLAQVADDVCAAYAGGAKALVLSTWKRHLDLLAGALRERGIEPVLLTGALTGRERTAAIAATEATASGAPIVVLGTGSLIGEGFDAPVLDTLFLAAPISFKGRLVQYVGRVTRSHPGKEVAVVHDYHDVLTPVLASSWAKRRAGYADMGFTLPKA
ncbi:TOTE conflict system archaeo-eukaryotic primase domain-containing protein [Paeniglutamicibacter sp. R2-26]|uniref:TOTE conflict system archaeo-eukaryotic primase domain-containing protein n=1 Tax=Paeniglutamicibacter sp. R2-26 TaxID=3144417 RepID=UPI003EE57254